MSHRDRTFVDGDSPSLENGGLALEGVPVGSGSGPDPLFCRRPSRIFSAAECTGIGKNRDVKGGGAVGLTERSVRMPM